MIGRLLRRLRGSAQGATPVNTGPLLPPPRTISVITPSFNQAAYLPACLRSVAEQTLRACEHLVFDPGSTDGSRDIASAAAGVTLRAEPDDGQADAVGKGLRAARGDVIGWLNSDDAYADAGVFEAVLQRFSVADRPHLVYGRGEYVDAEGKPIRAAYVNDRPGSLPQRLQQELGILQPALFLRREVVEAIGVPDVNLHFALDYEYWVRAMKAGLRFGFLDRKLALARYYPDNKTMGRRGESYLEVCKVMKRHFGYVSDRWAARFAEFRVAGYDGILVNSSNKSDHDAKAVSAETVWLLDAWNRDFAALSRLSKPADAPTHRTAKAMAAAGIELRPHCRPVPEGAADPPGWKCYTVDKQRWAFRKGWVLRQTQRTHDAFEEFRRQRTRDVCVIVGNGPSLNHTDLSLLKGQDVFCSNYAYLKPDLFAHATYLAVVNNLVAEQGAGEINMLRGVRKLMPWWLGYCIRPDDDTFFFNSVGHAEFSTEIHRNVSWRHTVTFFHLQVAYWLGYRRVAMVGFDHSYRQAQGVAEGSVVDQQGADQNHFDPRYFKGKKWHAADVDAMEAMYRLAKQAFDADGRQIVNATVGGHLELFPRMELAAAVAG